MDGGICFNEWLIREGYLTLKDPTDDADADRQGRDRLEPDQGLGRRRLLRPLLHERAGARARGHDRSRPTTRRSATSSSPASPPSPTRRDAHIGSQAFRPEDIYRDVRGVAPDLIVYFGDLAWRSVGAVGMGGIHTFENDTGPDEANHDWYGIFVLSTRDGGGAAPRRALGDLSIYDVAPTVLRLLDQPMPADMIGTSLVV